VFEHGGHIIPDDQTFSGAEAKTDEGIYTNRFSPRRCTKHIDRCDRRWSNPDIDHKCKLRTDYVFAGNRAFRNSDCARCNFVNETYLKCERTTLFDEDNEGNDNSFVENVYAPIIVRLNFSTRQAVVIEQSMKSIKEMRMAFKACGEAGRSVYDPFAGKCRLLYCDRESGEEFHEGRCLKRVPLFRAGDGKNQDDEAGIHNKKRRQSKTKDSSDEDNDDYDDLETTINFEKLDRNDSDSTTIASEQSTQSICDRIYPNDYNIVDDNDGTIFIKSRNVILDRDRYYFNKNHSLFICPLKLEDSEQTTEDDVQPLKLTIIRYNSSYQRLASIFGLVLAILCLLVSIAAYSFYSEMRSSAFGRSFLCLMLSMLLAHLLYLVIQLVERFIPEQLTCFCLSASAQFASLATVFWLNVMSIIVFNATLQTHSAATTSTTLNERSRLFIPPSPSSGFTSFLLFSLYAWVVPLAIVAASIAVAAFGIDGGYDPDEETVGCWTLGLTQLLLLIVPIALILVGNFSMYAVIFFHLCLRPIRVHTFSLGGDNSFLRQTTFSHLDQQSKSTRHQFAIKEMRIQEQRYTISFELSVVMTLTWTFATLSSFTHWPLMSYLFIIFSTFLAVTVCLTAVCNKQLFGLISSTRRRVQKIADDRGRRIHSETVAGKYSMLDMDGATVCLKDDKNNIVLRETSI